MLALRPLLLGAAIGAAVGFSAERARAQDVIGGNIRPLAESSVQLVVDSPQPLGQRHDGTGGTFYRLAGWAADVRAFGSTGVRQIVVYLDGPAGRGRLLGWARYGLPRPDVASALNNPAAHASGFELDWRVADTPLQVVPVREYQLYVYLEAGDGWVVARVPVMLANWTEDGSTR